MGRIILLVYGGGAVGTRIAGLLKGGESELSLAGRQSGRSAEAARGLGIPWRCADVHDDAALDIALRGARVLVNAAGPFGETSFPLMRACVRNGCHYVDISNEISSFHAAWSLEGEAREAQINIVPGAGYGTAVTEVLARHVAARIPGPTGLTIVRSSHGGTRSAGVRRTTKHVLAERPAHYANGALAPASGRVRTFDLPGGRKAAVPVSTGDLYSAALSTGIGDVATYFSTDLPPLLAGVVVPTMRCLIRTLPGGGRPTSQSEKTRANPKDPLPLTQVWIQAHNVRGQVATSYIDAGKGSDLTAAIAAEAARRMASLAPWGAHTSGSVLAPEFVLGFPGVSLTDL